MMSLVLFDNTVLTNFSLANEPRLAIAACPGQPCTTSAVLAEHLAASGEHALAEGLWCDLHIIEPTEEEQKLAGNLPRGLGSGERTCLALAIARRGLIATDDLHARRVAARYGVRVTGTLGLLVLAVESHLVSLERANMLLNVMVSAGYHSPVATLDALLG
jgi:predicted nucleic acid-binding protein